jgi:putative membrane protein
LPARLPLGHDILGRGWGCALGLGLGVVNLIEICLRAESFGFGLGFIGRGESTGVVIGREAFGLARLATIEIASARCRSAQR